MRNQATFVGLGLVFGAGIGYALGLVLTDAATAALFGAAGAGLGLVIGAAVGSMRPPSVNR